MASESVVAHAIRDERLKWGWDAKWKKVMAKDEILAQVAIAAHIDALTAAGYVIVPREPTDEMIDAAWRPSCDPCDISLSRERAEEGWRAMLASAPPCITQ